MIEDGFDINLGKLPQELVSRNIIRIKKKRKVLPEPLGP